ncbi:phosphatidylserine/phosphatidylglycerophosphate/cardiolipin synthase-like enzyme [Pedobacter sp. UYEF25]
MTISPFATEELKDYVTGSRTGRELIKLFNNYGFRDVYDDLGLPNIGKRNGQRPSRTEYVVNRLKALSGKNELRDLLAEVFNNLEKSEQNLEGLNKALNPEKFSVVLKEDIFIIQGGVIDKSTAVVNEAHFQDIQNKILTALDGAKVSIRVVMAWFTNDTLFKKLVEKHAEGVDVRVAIFDDGINKKHGVDITQLPHDMIKRGKRGGLMHNKFCVIDNQLVVTGSYNWSDNAEFRNDENVTLEKDPAQATAYSVEYKRLTT